jgi:NAD(P)-dependent dehydrogenase (short-subunit alcohol dehydrogenase family)
MAAESGVKSPSEAALDSACAPARRQSDARKRAPMNKLKRLNRRTAIITGAASGIGLATARLFAAEGAAVVLVDRVDPAVTIAAIRRDGHACVGATIDVSNAASIDSLVDETLDRFGGIDILVNGAGVEIAKTIAETTEAEWKKLIDVNLKGVALCSRAVITAMRRASGGCIVNVGSELGLVGGSSVAAYCASKGGVVQLSREMASDPRARTSA